MFLSTLFLYVYIITLLILCTDTFVIQLSSYDDNYYLQLCIFFFQFSQMIILRIRLSYQIEDKCMKMGRKI